MDGWVAAVEVIARETTLFAAFGLLIGGIDDLAVDLVFLIRLLRLRLAGQHIDVPLSSLPASTRPGRVAVFVAAWDEAAVIGAMLRAALARLAHADYLIFVGTYPNDPATIDAVAAVAREDPRVRLVVGSAPGPTTKADNLNAVWLEMLREEQEQREHFKAVVLHDSEDVLHPDELRAFDALIEHYAVVQIPVLPLIDRGSPFVSGHYADEFVEHHVRQLPVREAVGAALPLAGTGCAIERGMLGEVADARGGLPFDPDSLTEDYELGLTIARLGGLARFARLTDARGGLVAVRAYFPATADAAVRQKARWMIGIALAGWDRIGWGEIHHFSDHWMRMRDRRAVAAVLVLTSAYLALVLWAVSLVVHWAANRTPPPLGRVLATMLAINSVLLAWRLGLRAILVGRAYGRKEGALSVPRILVANFIAMLAARTALFRYFAMLRGGAIRWDKTAHQFPELAGGETSV